MYDGFSTYFLERYARDHSADLLAEAEKARLIKEALVHLTPRQASRTRDVRFRLRSILTVLASYILGCENCDFSSHRGKSEAGL